MPLCDAQWQDAATDNAKRGYPWAVWGFREGAAGCLLDSKDNEADARRFAEHERKNLRPKGKWVVIVVNESP